MPTKEELEKEILEQKEDIERLKKQFVDGSKEYEQCMNAGADKDATIAALISNKEIMDQKLKVSLRKISDAEAEIQAMKDLAIDALKTITEQHTKIAQLEYIVQHNLKPVHRT